MKKVIVAVDPGKTNLAWVILDMKGRILKRGLLKETYISLTSTSIGKRKNKIYTDVKDYMSLGKNNLKKVLDTIKKYTSGYDVTYVYERFVPRGRFNKGNTTEIIGMVIGILSYNIRANSVIPLMAATWKNHAKKHYGYEDKFNKTLPQHLIDAQTIGLYFLEKQNYLTRERIYKILSKSKRKNHGWKHTNKLGWER